MKKYAVSLSAIVLAFGLSACGKTTDEDPSLTENGHEENDMGVPADTDEDNKHEENSDAAEGTTEKDEEGVTLEVNKEAADKVRTVQGVEDASVLTAGDDAYVSVVLTDGTEETSIFQSEIEDAAKSVIPDKKVHISTDKETAEEVKGYADRTGEDAKGLYDEFKGKVKDWFPDSNQ
ncbi:YhcN/YlaJ family sporulation lipoprotein [Bhargavaea ullalensis]|uniref:YhcN/YlaJ family sporulation lipoprotein n=1 Tax=Bhargavaea ullalensis TaxID=1265685 RepID=A0ABV2GDI8_9BACL